MTIRGQLIVSMNEREYKYEQQKAHNADFWSREPAFFALCHDTAQNVQQKFSSSPPPMNFPSVLAAAAAMGLWFPLS